jgi:hypothetical protein
VTADDAGNPAFRTETFLELADEDGSEDFVELSIFLREGILAGVFRPPESQV